MSELSGDVRTVLEDGVFCHVAATTLLGPHVTPMVFALAGDRLWVTTSRGSVKASAWRRDDRVAGVVTSRDGSVAFAGRATWHDALEPSSWARSLLEAPMLALATARFTAKNGRFFAGYAIDASHVPFAWTPPGRVFVELTLDRWALIRRDRVRETGWDDLSDRLPHDPPSRTSFRLRRAGAAPLAPLPVDVRTPLRSSGRGVLAIEGIDGCAALPVAWGVEGSTLCATTSEEVFGLAGATSSRPRVALGIDRPSSWRARHMIGAMARGEGDVSLIRRLGSGAGSARRAVASVDPDLEPTDAALVTIRPERFVWWRGWSSGTVTAA